MVMNKIGMNNSITLIYSYIGNLCFNQDFLFSWIVQQEIVLDSRELTDLNTELTI